MNDRDRALLGLVGAGVLLVWWSSLPRGLGWPSLAGGRGPDQGGRDGPEPARPAPKGVRPGSGRTAGGGASGEGVIDVTDPELVSPEEYARRKRARARAARKPKP